MAHSFEERNPILYSPEDDARGKIIKILDKSRCSTCQKSFSEDHEDIRICGSGKMVHFSCSKNRKRKRGSEEETREKNLAFMILIQSLIQIFIQNHFTETFGDKLVRMTNILDTHKELTCILCTRPLYELSDLDKRMEKALGIDIAPDIRVLPGGISVHGECSNICVNYSKDQKEKFPINARLAKILVKLRDILWLWW